MLNVFKRLALFVAVASLVGCAATVTQTSNSASSPVSTSRAQAPAGALVAVVTGTPAAQANGDWQPFLAEWQGSLAAAASTARMPFVFARDETAIPSNASVLVRLKVNNFRYLSPAKRFMLGIMAGNAYMDVDAEYVELPANKPFGSKKFNTSSTAWEGIFSAVTPKQVQTVSEIIVKEVVLAVPAK